MKRFSISREDIESVPKSKFYIYYLDCGHEAISRVRIRIPESYSYMEHFVRCPILTKHEPLSWVPIIKMEAANDDVSDVPGRSAFIVSNRILRTDGALANHDGKPNKLFISGNPFPYTPKDRDY